MYYRCFPAFALLLLVGILGCGADKAKVSGTVTLDGKPLETGMVTFHPAEGNGAVAIGSIEKGGKYSMSVGTDPGLSPGEYAVTVVAVEQLPPTANAEGAIRSLVPEKYGNAQTSGWKFQVKSGSQTIPLDLKSQP